MLVPRHSRVAYYWPDTRPSSEDSAPKYLPCAHTNNGYDYRPALSTHPSPRAPQIQQTETATPASDSATLRSTSATLPSVSETLVEDEGFSLMTDKSAKTGGKAKMSHGTSSEFSLGSGKSSSKTRSDKTPSENSPSLKLRKKRPPSQSK